MVESKKPIRRRGGLGRGIESLIPSTQREERMVDSVKPMDIFFPPRPGEQGVQKGGSARDLLSPRVDRAGRASSEGSRTGRSGSSGSSGRNGRRRVNQSGIEKGTKKQSAIAAQAETSVSTAGETNAASGAGARVRTVSPSGKSTQKAFVLDEQTLDVNVSRETIATEQSGEQSRAGDGKQTVDVTSPQTRVGVQISADDGGSIAAQGSGQIGQQISKKNNGVSKENNKESGKVTDLRSSSKEVGTQSRKVVDNKLTASEPVESKPVDVQLDGMQAGEQKDENLHKPSIANGDSFQFTSTDTDSLRQSKSSSSADVGSGANTSGAESVVSAVVTTESTQGTIDVNENAKAIDINQEQIVSRETIDEITDEADEVADEETDAETSNDSLTVVPGMTFGMLSPKWIIPNSRQPRQVFSENELQELSESISEVGLLQPIVVRPINFADRQNWHELLEQYVVDNPDARYELIMGERRWRAAQRADLDEIPVIVRRTDDDDLLRDALMENLHRVQLNPIEEASAYQQLLEDFNCTQEILSERVRRSRSQIANTLRLLKLPPTVQRQVAAGVLSAGHARALLSVNDRNTMEKLAKRIIQEGLSVRAIEEIVKQINGRKSTKERTKRSASRISPENASVARAVADKLDTEVTIVEGKGKSRLVITFADTADLARIAEIIGINPQ